MSDNDDQRQPGDRTPAESTEPTAPEPVSGFEESTAGLPWRVALILLIGATIVVFAVQNTQDVQLQFLAWDWAMPLVIVILVAVVLAVLADEVIGGIVRRRRVRRRRERDELQRLRKMS